MSFSVSPLRRPKEDFEPMDRITESLLAEFSQEREITSLPEERQFEHFACYVTVRHLYGESFDTEHIITGDGQDTGIDGVAIIVNDTLITDIDDFTAINANAANLDVVFAFIQATRSPTFDVSKIGTFVFGVSDFFEQFPRLQRNSRITDIAAIMSAIYKDGSSKFKRGNPACILYYVTTGTVASDPNIEARKAAAIADLRAKNMFDKIEFNAIGASEAQKLYRQAKNAISKEFTFANRTVVPEIAEVADAYIGLVTAPEFLSILQDDSGNLLKSIFYDNVRDWQDYNPVNQEIRSTLESTAKRPRFALMNNGVTIIARTLRPIGNRIRIEDFQIVNGCQTSHVLFAQKDHLDGSVTIPLRLISTQNEEVINSIIRATNRQTQVKEDQFFALTEFPRSLEDYFKTFPLTHRLYYERRSRQYESQELEKTRVVNHDNLTKAFASTFLEEPHGATRNYTALKARMGKEDLYGKNHKVDPYYVAAFAWYKLEQLFRSKRIESKFKPARYQVLLAARLFANGDMLPRWNSKDMEEYCNKIKAILWDQAGAESLFERAAKAVEELTGEELDRDKIRTQSFTESLLAKCGGSRRPKQEQPREKA
jgi:hypothetical protein